VKLLEAHASEANILGSWNQIGYIPPKGGATDAFTYTEENAVQSVTCPDGAEEVKTEGVVKGCQKDNADGSGTIDVTASASKLEKGFQATNKINLNSCTAGGLWEISSSITSTSSAAIKIIAKITGTDCEGLTPSFTKLNQ